MKDKSDIGKNIHKDKWKRIFLFTVSYFNLFYNYDRCNS